MRPMGFFCLPQLQYAFVRASLAALLIVIPAGCIPYDIPPDSVTHTNLNIVVRPAGHPASATVLPTTFRVTRNDIVTSDRKQHMVEVLSDPARPLIVFCGGNSFTENTDGANIVTALIPFGDVVLFDYPGLGESTGKGTKNEYFTALDTMAVRVTALAAQRSGKLVFWGHSLGTGFCAALAAKVKTPSITVLAGAFDTVEDVANNIKNRAIWYGALLNPKAGPEVLDFEISARLEGYTGPILLLASDADDVIPIAVSRKLAKRLQQAGHEVHLITLENTGHGSLHQDTAFPTVMAQALSPFGINYTPVAIGTPVPSPNFVWPDGSYYDGAIHNGLFDGPGTLHFADGSVLQASFDKGSLTGTARYTATDGTVTAGPVQDTRLIPAQPAKADPSQPLNTPQILVTVLVDAGGKPTLGIANTLQTGSSHKEETAAWQQIGRIRQTIRSLKYIPASINGIPVPAVAFILYHDTP